MRRLLAGVSVLVILAALVSPAFGRFDGTHKPHPRHSRSASPTPSPTTSPTGSLTSSPSPTASGTDHRLTCTGYPQPRVFIDAQAWWLTTPGQSGTAFGHVHEGACVPEGQTVSGVLTLDVRIVLHNASNQTGPVSEDYTNPVIKTDSQELSLPHVTTLHGFACPTTTCTAWEQVSLDTGLSIYDGRQEVRLRNYARTSDGNVMHTSLNFHALFANGKTSNPIDYKPYERGKGWYTGSGYCEASFLTNLTPIPYGPVSGVWHPAVKIMNHGASDDLAVTHHRIAIDQDLHAVPPIQGTTVSDGAGELAQTTLSIDTTTLVNGSHKLALRADCADPRGSTNSGVLVIPFGVAN